MVVIIDICMVICFLYSLFFLLGEVTGSVLVKFAIKTLSLAGVVLPVVYFLKRIGMVILN